VGGVGGKRVAVGHETAMGAAAVGVVAGNAEQKLDAVEVGGQVRIADRPVLEVAPRDRAVEAASAEIGVLEAERDGAVVHRAPADALAQPQDLADEEMLAVVLGVSERPRLDVGILYEELTLAELQLVVGELRRGGPGALLQYQDVEAGIGQNHGGDTPAGAGTDDDHIGWRLQARRGGGRVGRLHAGYPDASGPEVRRRRAAAAAGNAIAA